MQDQKNISQCKYKWNDSVVIKKDAPIQFHPGETGIVCDMSQIKFEEIAEKYHSKLGNWIYTVEFGDGSDAQIPECYLDKDLSLISAEEISKYKKFFAGGFFLGIELDIESIDIKLKINSIELNSVGFLSSLDGFLILKIIITQIEEINLKNIHFIEKIKIGNVLEFDISERFLKLVVEWERSKISSFEIKASQILGMQQRSD